MLTLQEILYLDVVHVNSQSDAHYGWATTAPPPFPQNLSQCHIEKLPLGTGQARSAGLYVIGTKHSV